MNARPFLVSSLTLLALSVSAFAVQDSPADARRASIVRVGERFATVRWTAQERHAFHGEDENGVRVDTPDVSLDDDGWKPGADNTGMPYCWGGFTSLEGFESELAESRWAGHVPATGNAHGSGNTIGVDCSGFVSRCWSLPLKQSTRSLGALCYELEDYSELLPGDIVNRFDAHVAMFVGWANEERTTMRVLEAARLRVEESTYDVELLRSQDFRPMRYKPLDERWQPIPIADPARDTVLGEGARFMRGGGDAPRADPLPAALRAGESPSGSWARYEADEHSLSGDDVSCTWMAVEGAAGRLELQRRLDVGTSSLATGASLALDLPWAEVLTAFGNFSNPLRDFEVVTTAVTPGTYRAGEHEFEARRVTALVEANMLSRSTLYPAVLELDVILSDRVPLFGICEATLKFEIDYGMIGEDRRVGRAEHRYRLTAFAGR